MAETDTTLKQKTSELQTALSEVRRELSRVDEAHRSAQHRKLVEICNAAADWLEKHGDKHGDAAAARSDEDIASLSQQAEGFLHDIRMLRHSI